MKGLELISPLAALIQSNKKGKPQGLAEMIPMGVIGSALTKRFEKGGAVKADMVSPRKAMAMGMTPVTKKAPKKAAAKKGKK